MGNVLYFAKHNSTTDFESADILSIDFNEENTDQAYKAINKCYFKYTNDVKIGQTDYRKFHCRFAYKENLVGYIEGSKITELT